MAKNIIKLTESELEGLVKKIMLEENRTPSKKLKSSKSLNEGRELLRKFHNKKKSLIKEGYTRKQINEQFSLTDFFGGSSYKSPYENTDEMGDSFISGVGLSSAKQWIAGWVLSQLNVTGELNRVLSIVLSKVDIKDYPKLFDPVDNCDFIGDILFDTFLQYLTQKITTNLGTKAAPSMGSGNFGSAVGGALSSDLFSIVAGNAITRMVNQTQFKKDIEKYFKRAICEALGGSIGEEELSSDLEGSKIPKNLVQSIQKNL